MTRQAQRLRARQSRRPGWLLGLSLGAIQLLAQAQTEVPPTTASIQINQIGFLPLATKWAAVPVMGQLANAPMTARLVEVASGTSVWQGALGRSRRWAESGQSLRLLDFSAWQRPGHYRLEIAGLPPSPPFEIGDQVYAALNAAALKAFYFNRASTELLPAHAGVYARAPGHDDLSVQVHASASGPQRRAGDLIQAPKGWYDAGDYNKYIVNSAITVYTLLAAYEHFPALFEAQNLQIPESGRGLPDLLAEVMWNLEWMLAMQDPDDGGVYHKLTNLGFDGWIMPAQASTPRYVVLKSSAATLDFAATLAMAYRVLRPFEAQLERQHPQLLPRLQTAALRAWDWAAQRPLQPYRQPAEVQTGQYDDEHLQDERAWAATELYLLTGEPRFQAAMCWQQAPLREASWSDVQGLAWISLAQHRDRLTAEQRALLAQRFAAYAQTLDLQARRSGAGLAVQAADFVWGSNAVLLNKAMMLLQAYRLDPRPRTLELAQGLMDYVLGRNALGLSMVTGMGQHSPRHPHHRPSEADGIVPPVPGFLVGGPNPGRQDQAACPVTYASARPALAYLDHACSYASNEVAINWNAPLVYVSAALQALNRSAP